MRVYLVVEFELLKNISRNVGIFSTKEKAQKFIENRPTSGDYFEYGITPFLVDNWEA